MNTDIKKVAVVDGMSFVSKVNIKKNHIQNCEEFASCFIDIIDKETAEYLEVRIVFNRYQKNSLKGNTSVACSSYKGIFSSSLQSLCYNKKKIKTKKESTQYLSAKLSQHFVKDYMVVFDKTGFTNTADLDNNLRNYNHEEADTGIVLHCARGILSQS